MAVAVARLDQLRLFSSARRAYFRLTSSSHLTGWISPLLLHHLSPVHMPGTLIYQFEAPLVFYNVENFTTRVRALVSAAPEPLRFFLYDAEASWGIDSTAADELRLL